MSEWKKEKVKYKYTPLPEDPKYKKKKNKKIVKKSDHKHIYKPCYFKSQEYISFTGKHKFHLWKGTYCCICGRINDMWIRDVRHVDESLPIFSITGLLDKEVNFGD